VIFRKEYAILEGKEIPMTELICTGCGTACRMNVETDGDGGIRVSGNACPTGESFARSRTGAAAGNSGPADGWNRIGRLGRRLPRREMREVHDRMHAFGRLLHDRRRAIRPEKWEKIRAVLENSYREIDALLND
jgi:anaerobic selenocysteine-containing dehydrogenase